MGARGVKSTDGHGRARTGTDKAAGTAARPMGQKKAADTAALPKGGKMAAGTAALPMGQKMAAGTAALPMGQKRAGIPMRARGQYSALGYRVDRVLTADGRIVPQGRSNHVSEWSQRNRLVAQSRDFMRNNGIYKGIIERMVSYIVGGGFGLQAATPLPELNAALERGWRIWGRDPEVSGLLTWAGVQQMAARELLVAGDTATIKTTRGKLQLIESEQIVGAAASNFSGIEVDGFGRPVKFFVAPYKQGALQPGDARELKPSQLLYLMVSERPSDVRGFPVLQSSFPMMHRIADVCDAEALAWQLQSRLAVAVTKEGAAEEAYAVSAESDEAKDESMASRLTELDYAMIFHGEPGESVKGIERTAPGASFPESLRMFLRLLGQPAGLPLEHILLDWSGGNYSQSRAVLEQAYQMFRGWQDLLETGLCSPAYRWKAREWRKQGWLDEYGARDLSDDEFLAHTWVRPTFPWIDQLKETEAYGAKVERGFASHGDVLKSLGQDRETVLLHLERETREAVEIAKRLSDELGVQVGWERFAGLTMGKTEAAVRAQAGAAAAATTGEA